MIEYDEIIRCNGMDSLFLNIKGGNITIYKVEGDKITIKGLLGTFCNGFAINKIDNEIKLQQMVSFSPIKIGFPNSINLNIGVPTDLFKNIMIKQDLGNLSVKDINIKDIEIKLKAAKLSIDDILCDFLDVRIGTKTATVNLERKCGDIKIHSLSGKFDVSMKEIGGDLNCTAGAGGGNIKIPRDSQVKVNKRGVQNCKLDAVLADTHLYNINLIANLGGVNVVN